MPADRKPIACTLGAGDYNYRVTWIAELNRCFLKLFEVKDLKLRLVYDPRALMQIRRLVALEQQCCAFLRFDVMESTENVALTIDVPECAGSEGAQLLASFLAGTTSPLPAA